MISSDDNYPALLREIYDPPLVLYELTPKDKNSIVIVGSLWPVLWWINRQPWAGRVRVGMSIVIFLFGAAWFTERVFGLKFMPI